MMHVRLRLPALAALLTMATTPAFADQNAGTVVPRLPDDETFDVSTIPAPVYTGDTNPYGVAFVPKGFPEDTGVLREGDILVSNFNSFVDMDHPSVQGTGTTIVRVHDREQTLFSALPDKPGLSTALGVLKRGWVLVGNVPSANGSGVCKDLEVDVDPGALTVLDRSGNPVQTLTSQTYINGPWDMTIRDEGDRAQIFISNLLSGTVSRLDVFVREEGDAAEEADPSDYPLFVVEASLVAKGYPHRCNDAAFVVGPTGLAFDERTDDLFVASTVDNTIFKVPDAGRRRHPVDKGTDVVPRRVKKKFLHGPLALLLAPNGDLVSSQGDAFNPDSANFNDVVELTQQGQFVARKQIDPGMPGGAFGIALELRQHGFRFAVADDNTNSLQVYDVP